MMRSLYSRLALTLFVLIVLIGLVLMLLIGHSSNLYQQEVMQKLNRELATHIVNDQALIQDGKINQVKLDKLFHYLMVVNPSIELYLLDPGGRILGYDAPEEKIKREVVDIAPIQRFVQGDMRFPYQSSDPRDPAGNKIFSAAEIRNKQGLQGYLYIILGGEDFDNVAGMIGDSFILDSALLVLLLALLVSLGGGLLTFAYLTRRLRLLGRVMGSYGGDQRVKNRRMRFPLQDKESDEIAALGRQFNDMSERINDQIEELQRMDGLRREMVANISHDLRTPLTTMRGYLETLLIKGEQLDAADKNRYLQTALDYSRHLSRLVEDLFELARLDACETVVYSEPFSMSELVQDVAQSFMLKAQQQSITLVTDLNQEAPLIYGDIAMMQRVLENLMENALRHTPDGGRITLRVAIDDGKVKVQVSDSGHGIADNQKQQIFDRFFQAEEHRGINGSTGLGLSIVKRILELHHSVISVDSQLDQGTTFSFLMNPRASAL